MGWIKLDRALLNHDIWNAKPFDAGHAWVDLLLLANHKEHKIFYKGEFVTCKRGEVNRSITWLAERWGWSWKKTKNFLMALEGEGMVRTNGTTNGTTVTIENYTKFQNQGRKKDEQTDETGQNEVRHTRRYKKDKENKASGQTTLEGSDSGLREARLAEMQRQDEEEKARLNRLAKERSNNEQRTAYRKINKRS